MDPEKTRSVPELSLSGARGLSLGLPLRGREVEGCFCPGVCENEDHHPRMLCGQATVPGQKPSGTEARKQDSEAGQRLGVWGPAAEQIQKQGLYVCQRLLLAQSWCFVHSSSIHFFLASSHQACQCFPAL